MPSGKRCACDTPNSLPALDGAFPYGHLVGDDAVDTPAYLLGGGDLLSDRTYTFSASYTMWLMCSPVIGGSIWVPLAQETWSINFSYTVTTVGLSAVVNVAPRTVSHDPETLGYFTATTAFPEWNWVRPEPKGS